MPGRLDYAALRVGWVRDWSSYVVPPPTIRFMIASYEKCT